MPYNRIPTGLLAALLCLHCGPSGIRPAADVAPPGGSATTPTCSSLAPGTLRLLRSLDRPLTVEAYVTRGSPALDAYVQELSVTLGAFERAAGGKLRVRLVEAQAPQQKAAARVYGLSEKKFEVPGAVTHGFMGLVFQYGSARDTIPMLSPSRPEGLEYWIAKTIKQVREQADGVQHRIGFVTGKNEIGIGEPNLVAGDPAKQPTMKSIVEQNFPFYRFEAVELKGGDAAIDDNLEALIITQPGTAFSDRELRRIDQFVLKGKALAVIASAASLAPAEPSMKISLTAGNLDKLLDGYGVEMAREVALDWSRQRIPAKDEQDRLVGHIIAPGLALAQYVPGASPDEQQLDSAFRGFFRLDELAFPFVSGLTLHQGKQPGATMRVVARTTPKTTAASGEEISLRPSKEVRPNAPHAQRNIAVAIEGRLRSAMGAGAADGIEIPAEAKSWARVIVISSSSFLANPYARSGRAPSKEAAGDEMLQEISRPYAFNFMTNTILAFKYTLDWMTFDQDIADGSARFKETCPRPK